MKKAIFIDKDGTLIEDVPYNADPDLVTFERFALESMLLLKNCGYKIVIITNQSGIALQYFNESDLERIEQKISDSFRNINIRLDGFYYCPHLPEAQCNCRKPSPGLILKAAKDLDIDLKNSWMIGDILNDVEAGNLSGAQTILVDKGHETEWLLTDCRHPDYTVSNLKEAAGIILSKKDTHGRQS